MYSVKSLARSATLFTIVAMGGCTERADRDLLGEAEALVLDSKWSAAREVLRERLLEDPSDAAAHYYLGRCHLMIAEDFRPVLAEGEFLLALELFERNGKTSPIERFSDEYFELMCYVDSAKVAVFQLQYLLEHDVPRRSLGHLVEKCDKYLALARAVNADAEEIEHVASMIGMLGFPRRSSVPQSTAGR